MYKKYKYAHVHMHFSHVNYHTQLTSLMLDEAKKQIMYSSKPIGIRSVGKRGVPSGRRLPSPRANSYRTYFRPLSFKLSMAFNDNDKKSRGTAVGAG